MRWFIVAILAYIFLAAQTQLFCPGGLAVRVDGHEARPDLVLMLGLLLAFFYRPAEVFVAGWCLGLASDAVAISGRMGLLALEFSVVLALISSMRASLPRTRILVRFLATLLVVLAVHAVWYAAAGLLVGGPLRPLESVERAALDAAYSAILAPYLFWGVLLLRAPLGISMETGGERDS
jgi:cell shape-determining protein MreD